MIFEHKNAHCFYPFGDGCSDATCNTIVIYIYFCFLLFNGFCTLITKMTELMERYAQLKTVFFSPFLFICFCGALLVDYNGLLHMFL